MNKGKKREAGKLMVFVMLGVFVVLVLTFWITIGILRLLARSGVIVLDVMSPGGLPLFALMFFFFLVSLAVGIITSVAVIFLPLKGLNALISGLHRLSEGDFSCRLEDGKVPIVHDISGSFNLLAEELSNTEMLRSDFVNNFSHEIKTPIVSIRGFAKLLEKEPLNDKQREYAEIIVQESDRVVDMTTKILDLARVENQAILSDVTTYNLSEQIRQCCLMLLTRADEKGVSFTLDFPEVDVEASKPLMMDVWMNLLDNAVKFSPDGGEVVVTLSQTNEDTTIAIANQSEPLSADVGRRIFQKFYQANTSHEGEGAGIGLSIVKRVVELHGGTAVAMWEDGRFLVRVKLSGFNN